MKPLLFNEKLNYHLLKCGGIKLGNHYLSKNSMREMVLSLAYTLQILLSQQITHSQSFVALMLDESTDCSNQSKLLLIVRYCEGFTPKEKYFALSTLKNLTAESIFKEAWEILMQENYLIERLIVTLADNAPTMQGEISGVLKRFQEKLPHIKEARCVSHLNILIVKNFINKFPRIFTFKIFLYKLVDYFRTSSKKTTIFRNKLDELETEITSLIMPFDIRWSSLYTSINRVLEVFPALIKSL